MRIKRGKKVKEGRGALVRKILLAIFLWILVAFLAFYIFVIMGASQYLQTMWVTSAMTTTTHQWLATSFIPEETINEILARERIDDSGHDTILEDIKRDDAQPELLSEEELTAIKISGYLENGYEQLEDNLFLKEISGTGYRGYIMLVSNPLDLILDDTPKQGVEGTSVRRMVENAGGIAGINGGGFNDGPNYDSNGGSVTGILIIDGELINPKSTSGSAEYNMIGFNSAGKLILRHATAAWAMENDIRYAVSFSPFLIVNGEGMIPEGSTGGWGIAPRTAIGQLESGEVLLLVIDGRQPAWSIGVDIKVLQDVLMEEGCINAAMMDGGSSTVMIYNNEFVNKPSLGHERFINNAWIVMPESTN